LLVEALGQVVGVVRRQDVQKPAGRMWLFGMITLIEMRLGRLIERGCPDDAWKPHISEGRVQKAQDLFNDRRLRNEHITLADCLQFADKAQIVARNESLRARTRFTSKRQLEDAAKRLERLRNNLAHSQDVITENWETIVTLTENLEFVLNDPE
jgi:hypothetical protein